MENTEALKTGTQRSFLWRWVLVNIVALPALLVPYSLGMFLSMGVAVVADGSPVGAVVYLIGFVILAVSGALIGAWFGFLQWLVLRRRLPRAYQWITASSLGLAVGTPLGWLAYGLLFLSPIVNRPDGIYFSFGYAYVIFGVLLGLSLGIAQWRILRQQVDQAGWWILALPICFTLGISLANFYFLFDWDVLLIQKLTQGLKAQFPGWELSNMRVLGFFAVLSSVTALVGVGVSTGALLNWLLLHTKPGEPVVAAASKTLTDHHL